MHEKKLTECDNNKRNSNIIVIKVTANLRLIQLRAN